MDNLRRLEQELAYMFEERALLREALTHSSFRNENKHYRGRDNERLEFLGDAVLGMVIAEHLFVHLGTLPEGALTKYRAKIVCEETLAEVARKLSLGEFIRFGKGEILTGGKDRPSILADAMESLIAAIYLDAGFETVRDIILRMLSDKIEQAVSGKLILDFKTALQERVQRRGSTDIVYRVMDEIGPDHNKIFVIAVEIDGVKRGQGEGRNKKEAEQNAAQDALETGLFD